MDGAHTQAAPSSCKQQRIELSIREVRQPRDHWHARARVVDTRFGTVLSQRANQCGATLAQFQHDLAEVAFECPGMHERRQRVLLDASTSEIVITFCATEIYEQARGTDEIAEPETREKRLREAADVDDPLARIERSQRRNLYRVVSKLSIVVIFDDPARVLRRVAKQLFAPWLRHDRSRRKLM